ncbi:alpha carbonic anhydrase 7-like isoform X2 [Nymphaea colorata]|uniref:alpha carbonic anhydrase 7-like isoform X2 n=1 Tax=Nymphaea colorata TaxID=210225 RepID=UPI00214E9FD6|nr:alpha carbonic anhydrase 7-like isoform X2 [Nymphaea colorata]
MSIKVISLLLFPIFCLLLSCSNASEVEKEKEFDYVEGSRKGPEHWSELSPEWAACRGKEQSPIDLLSKRVIFLPKLGRLKRRYKPVHAVLKNRGHDIMLQWVGDAGGIYIKGVKYELKQLHWHSPSEHSINGTRYQLELHMVHESREGDVAVVGILYKLGRPDSFLAKLMHVISRVDPTQEEAIGIVNPKDVKIGSRKYYRYEGSLTTPPCTEGVIWTIVKKGFEVNARPTQGTNDRPIWLYTPRSI